MNATTEMLITVWLTILDDPTFSTYSDAVKEWIRTTFRVLITIDPQLIFIHQPYVQPSVYMKCYAIKLFTNIYQCFLVNSKTKQPLPEPLKPVNVTILTKWWTYRKQLENAVFREYHFVLWTNADRVGQPYGDRDERRKLFYQLFTKPDILNNKLSRHSIDNVYQTIVWQSFHKDYSNLKTLNEHAKKDDNTVVEDWWYRNQTIWENQLEKERKKEQQNKRLKGRRPGPQHKKAIDQIKRKRIELSKKDDEDEDDEEYPEFGHAENKGPEEEEDVPSNQVVLTTKKTKRTVTFEHKWSSYFAQNDMKRLKISDVFKVALTMVESNKIAFTSVKNLIDQQKEIGNRCEHVLHVIVMNELIDVGSIQKLESINKLESVSKRFLFHFINLFRRHMVNGPIKEDQIVNLFTHPPSKTTIPTTKTTKEQLTELIEEHYKLYEEDHQEKQSNQKETTKKKKILEQVKDVELTLIASEEYKERDESNIIKVNEMLHEHVVVADPSELQFYSIQYHEVWSPMYVFDLTEFQTRDITEWLGKRQATSIQPTSIQCKLTKFKNNAYSLVFEYPSTDKEKRDAWKVIYRSKQPCHIYYGEPSIRNRLFDQVNQIMEELEMSFTLDKNVKPQRKTLTGWFQLPYCVNVDYLSTMIRTHSIVSASSSKQVTYTMAEPKNGLWSFLLHVDSLVKDSLTSEKEQQKYKHVHVNVYNSGRVGLSQCPNPYVLEQCKNLMASLLIH